MTIIDSMKNRVAKALSNLPERERLIVALYYYESLTLAEIAGIMNMTEERVTAIMSGALTKIREEMCITS